MLHVIKCQKCRNTNPDKEISTMNEKKTVSTGRAERDCGVEKVKKEFTEKRKF